MPGKTLEKLAEEFEDDFHTIVFDGAEANKSENVKQYETTITN